MSIRLAISGRPPLDLDEESISLGSDAASTVSFPESTGVKPKHALIRKIAGRWLIEVREAESIVIGGSEPKRLHWLIPGDMIQLSDLCPAITFQPAASDAHELVAPHQLVAPKNEQLVVDASVILPPDSDTLLLVTGSDRSTRESSADAKFPARTMPPKLSDTPPILKPASSSTIRAVKIDGMSAHPDSTRENSANRVGPEPGPSRPNNKPTVPAKPLKRMSSSDDFPDLDDVPQGLGLTDQNSEINWIMMVIGWSAATGVVLLVVWMAISFILGTLAQPQYGSPPTPVPTTQNR